VISSCLTCAPMLCCILQRALKDEYSKAVGQILHFKVPGRESATHRAATCTVVVQRLPVEYYGTAQISVPAYCISLGPDGQRVGSVSHILKMLKKQEPDRLSVECDASTILQRSSTVANAWRVIAGSDTLLPQIKLAVLNLQKSDSISGSSSNTSSGVSSSSGTVAAATAPAASPASSTTGSSKKGKRKARLSGVAAASAAAAAASSSAAQSEGRRIALWMKKPLDITQELQRLTTGSSSSSERSWISVGKKQTISTSVENNGYAMSAGIPAFDKQSRGLWRIRYTLDFELMTKQTKTLTACMYFDVTAGAATAFTVALRPYDSRTGAVTDMPTDHSWHLGDSCDIAVTVVDEYGNGTSTEYVAEQLELVCEQSAVQLTAATARGAQSLTPTVTAATATSGLTITWRNWSIAFISTTDTPLLSFTTPTTALDATVQLAIKGVPILDTVHDVAGLDTVDVALAVLPGNAHKLCHVTPSPLTSAAVQNKQVITGLNVKAVDSYGHDTGFVAGTRVMCVVDNKAVTDTTATGTTGSVLTLPNFTLDAAAGTHSHSFTATGLQSSAAVAFAIIANQQIASLKFTGQQQLVAHAAATVLPPQQISTEATVYMSVKSKDNTVLAMQPTVHFIALLINNEITFYSNNAAKHAELCATGKIVLLMPDTPCTLTVKVCLYTSVDAYAADVLNDSTAGATRRAGFKLTVQQPPLHHLAMQFSSGDNHAVVCGETKVTDLITLVGKSISNATVTGSVSSIQGTLTLAACDAAATDM
jgi:hypothetical protein